MQTINDLTAETEDAMKRFLTGENFYSQHVFGCHQENREGKEGYLFGVWAPNAGQVWLVGTFNDWNDSLPMEKNEHYGYWEVFTTIASEGDMYKYKVRQADGRDVFKIDPFAIHYEKRPGNAAVIYNLQKKKWRDGLWFGRKKRSNFYERPINIYEVHASSWKHYEDGSPYTFTELKDELIPCVKKMGYTHVEFMPLMEHPLGTSWGYQLIGYFALSSYYGTPEAFQDFVEECHLNNIGVLVDWVPGHFCQNDDALATFDGTPQFEYQDPNRAKNIRWGAINFDLGKMVN